MDFKPWCCSIQYREHLYCSIDASFFDLYKCMIFLCVYGVSDMKAADEISHHSEASLKMRSQGILHMEKYEDLDYHPSNQHVRKWEGKWWGKGECSEPSLFIRTACWGCVQSGWEQSNICQCPTVFLALEFRRSSYSPM